MLEINIDKQAGIQLHTCQRKSRWCKVLLLLSWLLMLAFLGWLLWEGFLRLDKNIDKQSVQSSTLAQQVPHDCKKEVALSAEESKRNCDQQLVGLNKELKSALGKNSAKGLVALNKEKKEKELNRKLSKQLVDANQKLKTTEATLQRSQEELKKSEGLAADPNASKKLYFYEKILDVSSAKNAISIKHFAVKSQNKKRHYRFQLLLAKLGKHKVTKGTYDIFLIGNKKPKLPTKEKGVEKNSASNSKSDQKKETKKSTQEAVTYKHTGLFPAGSESTDNTFSFDYYQDLQGEFVLPENFELESFSVSINPQGLSTVRNSYKMKNLKKLSFKEVL